VTPVIQIKEVTVSVKTTSSSQAGQQLPTTDSSLKATPC